MENIICNCIISRCLSHSVLVAPPQNASPTVVYSAVDIVHNEELEGMWNCALANNGMSLRMAQYI